MPYNSPCRRRLTRYPEEWIILQNTPHRLRMPSILSLYLQKVSVSSLDVVNFSTMWRESLITIAVASASALCVRALYSLYYHPLAKFPGPWYAVSFSLSGAVISYFKVEPQWLQSLVEKYGSKFNESLPRRT